MDIIENVVIPVLGWAGAGVLLLAYGLVSAKKIGGDGITFQVMNLAGGLALAINSAYFGAWPSAVLNVIWVGIGVCTIAVLARRAARAARNSSVGPLQPERAHAEF